MSPLHFLSTIVLILIAIGIWKRKEPRAHFAAMLSAFIIDVALVLYIELTRHAVDSVTTQPGPLLLFHVAISVIVLAAYVFQLELGRRLLKGAVASRSLHIWVGVTFCSLRLVNYITSFYI